MSLILDGTNGITLPVWTTGTRPASPNVGEIGFNSTISQIECWTGATWFPMMAPLSRPAAFSLIFAY
jgi:hypothetical protein